MKIDKTNLIGVSSLLVHAAKIDENYTENEKKLIEKFISTISEENLDPISLLKEAEKTESNSNQLLQFTQIVKKNSLELKMTIIQTLWRILISDGKVDEYESNLMRRICGLIYFPDKLSAEIKLKIIKELKSL
tara:strand:+ start:3919 stop:4317 length:399 start_codon:yes stop_codon:yes gene_type:complete